MHFHHSVGSLVAVVLELLLFQGCRTLWGCDTQKTRLESRVFWLETINPSSHEELASVRDVATWTWSLIQSDESALG